MLGILCLIYFLKIKNCAVIKSGDDVIATLGQIHPLVMQNYGVSVDTYAAELDFDKIFEKSTKEKHYKSLPKFIIFYAIVQQQKN